MNDKHINITIENNIFSKNKGCDKKVQNNKGLNNKEEPVRGFVDEPEHIKKARHALAAKALQLRQPDNPYLIDYNQQMASIIGQSAHYPYVYNNYNQYKSPYGDNTVENKSETRQIEVVEREEEDSEDKVSEAAAEGETEAAAGAAAGAVAVPGVLFKLIEDDKEAYIGPPESFDQHKKARREAINRYKKGHHKMRDSTIKKYGLEVFKRN
jgi:hypothetical protein